MKPILVLILFLDCPLVIVNPKKVATFQPEFQREVLLNVQTQNPNAIRKAMEGSALRTRSFTTLDDWRESSDLPAASIYGEKLTALGVCAETFRGETQELMDLFVGEGIPRLPERDIVKSATKFFAKQHELASLPLAVFWDAQNMPISSTVSGGKSVIAKCSRVPLDLGRWTFSMCTLMSIRRVSLLRNEASCSCHGWHIIDTPHRGVGENRKEVAEKMIIVDAMFYAMQRSQTGAMLCFITGDADFAYLLSRLKTLQKLRTIVVYNVNPTLKTVNWSSVVLGRRVGNCCCCGSSFSSTSCDFGSCSSSCCHFCCCCCCFFVFCSSYFPLSSSDYDRL
jgi:hypothetical protein